MKKNKRFLIFAAALLLALTLLTSCDSMSEAVDAGLGFLDRGMDFFSRLMKRPPAGTEVSGDSSLQPPEAGRFSAPEDFLFNTENVLVIPPMTSAVNMNITADCVSLRGVCSDGEFFYAAMSTSEYAGSDCSTVLVKLDRAGGVVRISDPMKISQINDLCYNPRTNQLVAVHTAPDAQDISVFDASTLRLSRAESLPLQIYSITYDSADGCYYAGILYGYNYAVLDEKFGVLRTCSGKNNGFTQESMDSDGEFIFSLFSAEDCVTVLTVDGEYKGTIRLSAFGADCTPQMIFHIGSDLYVVFRPADGTGGTIVRLTPASGAETAAQTEG